MRKDGLKVKDAELMYLFVPHIMKERNDAMNMITLDIPVEPMHKYINEKRRENFHVSHLSLFLAAYVQVIAEFPLLNRFVVNKTIYDRTETPIAMVTLRPGDNDSTMSKIYFQPGEDIFSVCKKIDDFIAINTANSAVTNSMDKFMNLVVKIPGLLRFGVPILMWMDKHGLMPKKIIDLSPFHASMTVTNLASIRTNHIYHHIYNFGTTSVICALGNLRYVPSVNKDGQIKLTRCMPIGVVMDERICSGHYFSRAFRSLQKYLLDPHLLEKPFSGEIHM
ncbi:MAG: 2-oxo acid dehydrogenase subunit E2 [Bacillota bacterium]|nr:2-oxo acid dehydrogenase subunit E2 [Bacillota bacterium]